MNFLQKLTCLYWDLVTKVGFFTDDQPNVLYIYDNKPLAPRGHVTNASFKQWVGISCWCQKLTEYIKIILHPKFERKRI